MTARSVWRTPMPVWVKRMAPLTLVIAVHGVVLLGLLSLAPVRNALNMPAVLTIDLIRPPPPPPPPPVARKEPPKPKEAAVAQPLPRPVPQLPLLVAPAEAPSPVVVAPQPEPPRVAPPIEAVPVPATPPVPAPKPAAAPKVVTAVEYVRAPQPQYPVTARRRGEQGRVTLRVFVNAQGQPERAEVQQSSGVAVQDDAARRAALQALFKPHLENGQPVPVWAIVPIVFSLEG